MTTCRNCRPVYFKHEDGWDAYRREDCERIGNTWIPSFFDRPLSIDQPTKAAAIREVADLHPAGLCLTDLYIW